MRASVNMITCSENTGAAGLQAALEDAGLTSSGAHQIVCGAGPGSDLAVFFLLCLR